MGFTFVLHSFLQLFFLLKQRIDKTHWITDYTDDIFQTLREGELRRRFVCFRSQQVCQRPALLKLLRTASEKYKLSRTTLHLGKFSKYILHTNLLMFLNF